MSNGWTVDELLLLPDDQIEYSTLESSLLAALATQQEEPFIATSALAELAGRGVPEAASAAETVLEAEPWDRHLRAFAIKCLFELDSDRGLAQMERLVDACSDPKLLAAMMDNVLYTAEPFDTADGRAFVERLTRRVSRMEADTPDDRELRREYLAKYGSRT